jgi:hypothetical protein
MEMTVLGHVGFFSQSRVHDKPLDVLMDNESGPVTAVLAIGVEWVYQLGGNRSCSSLVGEPLERRQWTFGDDEIGW